MRNKKLATALLAMMEADQTMRTKAIDDPDTWDADLDRQHTAKLKQIILQHGWPSISLVGVEAAHAAWLLVQHADHDLAFQEECLRLMKALPAVEVSLPNIAYLTDRILTSRGKPQLYGTQFQGTGRELKPQPIKNKSNLDMRRSKMGLGTFDEYMRLMFETFGEPT